MIQAIISLFGIVRGLFVAGGLFSSVITWFTTSGGWFAAAIIGLFNFIKDFFFGTFKAIKKTATYIAAYHVVEVARRIALIALITVVFGWVINYAANNVIVYGGKTITLLFNDYIIAINSFGALGHNLLAFMTKLGIFDSISLFITVMVYTLMTRVALSILFK